MTTISKACVVVMLSLCRFARPESALCVPTGNTQTATGYFDDDNLKDSISCTFARDSADGPVYQCRMSRGNGHTAAFDIPVAFKPLQISSCKKGCLETYQWMTGTDGYEEYNQYLFNKRTDNWRLARTITIYADGKKKIVKPTHPVTLSSARRQQMPR